MVRVVSPTPLARPPRPGHLTPSEGDVGSMPRYLPETERSNLEDCRNHPSFVRRRQAQAPRRRPARPADKSLSLCGNLTSG
jgi:hypothetical protein